MSRRTTATALRWWPFAIVVAAWLVVATQQIGLPGVYMDAVDPDYLAVGLLNPHAQPIGAWLLGGNYLFGNAPVLISFYHGSQQVWLGLPFFALFGTTVTGLRLTHAMFALAILGASYLVLIRGRLMPWRAALAGLALALDPAFSYAFRTQSYITLAPTAWLFVSLYALQRAVGAQSHRWHFVSGIFYGLAVVGYFIYAFFLPAILLALWLFRRDASATAGSGALRAELPYWLAGLTLGGIFYPVGYALFILDAGGLEVAWQQFQQTQQALGAFSAQTPLAERMAHVGTMFRAVFSNWFHHQLIFSEYAPLPGSTPKMWLLLALPVALWGYAEARGRSSALLRVLLALPISYVAVAMGFGTRLQGHHFVLLLPLAYAALAAALAATATGSPSRRRYAAGGAVIAFAGLAALNIAGQFVEAQRLAQTRGVGLFSDSINRLAADLSALEAKPFVYFPDWGLSMPVAFLTRGTVALDSVPNPGVARRMLCEGRDVAFAAITGDRAARIDSWQRELQWTAPVIVSYAQADGKVVFDLATFRGARDAPDCPARN
jgi:Dolichyl-phosphate-mannose-protein mannosyltransferase